MKPIPVLGIPHYNRPDLLARCIASIDYPVEKLVIIQNGPIEQMLALGELWKLADKRAVFVEVIRHPNAGVAASWNEIIKLFPARWWLISNNDIQFAPGDLAKTAEAVEGALERQAPPEADDEERAANPHWETPVAKWFGNHGASWFVITPFGVKRVGLFDENFYPAYLEDCDWHYRAKLIGASTRNLEDVHSLHGDGDKLTGSCTVNSDQLLRDKNVQTHSRNFGYYEYKWGGRNGHETFQYPYDEAGLPVWAWQFFPWFRKDQQW